MRKNVLLVIALFIATLNLRPAINSVAPLLEDIRVDLGMSAALASLLTSIPVLCMGLFSPFAAKASSRWGIERIIGYSLLIIGVGTIIRLFTHSANVLLLSSLIAGIGIATIGPLTSGFIKKHFPSHVPSVIAVYSIALTIGAASSTMLSGPVQEYFQSWQKAIGLWAMLAFIAAMLWWVLVKPGSAKTVKASGGPKMSLPWNNRRAWVLTLSFGSMAMLMYAFTAWLPLIIQEMGYSKSYASLCLTVFVLVQIPVSFILPVMLKKFPSRRLWMLTESFIVLASLILLISGTLPVVSALLFGLGAGGLFILNLLLPMDATSTAGEATSWSAMQQSAGYVIGATGPILLGWIHDASNSFSFALIGMILINIIMFFIQIAATQKQGADRSLSDSNLAA
ncbi:MFS transporter [Paenibacillus sp. FSL H8-0048]|uniref:MFS transporter n=1 Tax=Paenibacillus sp. FSL H8-0048 TaxID=2954508 RepID=UPI0030F9F741